jgi:hypothetical protein
MLALRTLRDWGQLCRLPLALPFGLGVLNDGTVGFLGSSAARLAAAATRTCRLSGRRSSSTASATPFTGACDVLFARRIAKPVRRFPGHLLDVRDEL